MLLRDYRDIFKKELESIYDEMEVDSMFNLVLSHLHDMKRMDLALNPKATIDFWHLRKWKKIVSELKKERPIQYILGETEFYCLRFLVNESTLIPRGETQELVEWIIDDAVKGKILDIGTGSGCIAITLAKRLSDANVTAIDVSEETLQTARKNAKINSVDVEFLLMDVLKANDLGQQFDVIVSNPPYVRNLEKSEMRRNVLEYEPHRALFVDDDDPLLFYRKIAQLAQKNLNPQGKIYFEINQYLGAETVRLLEDMGFKDIELRQDVFGSDRMISAVYS